MLGLLLEDVDVMDKSCDTFARTLLKVKYSLLVSGHAVHTIPLCIKAYSRGATISHQSPKDVVTGWST
jgi:hypothetical protein